MSSAVVASDSVHSGAPASRVSTRLPRHSGPAPTGVNSSVSTPIEAMKSETSRASSAPIPSKRRPATMRAVWASHAMRAAPSAMGRSSAPSVISRPSAV